MHVIRHPSFVHSVAFSPDGGHLVSASDKIVRIWNTATGELEDELEGHTNIVWSVAFSHNGCFIVSGSGDGTVRIWNTATWKTTYVLMGHRSGVRSVATSRNDWFVVSGSDDKTVHIWDTAKGELLRKLEGHPEEVISIAVSPDCQHIASGSDNKVWIWTMDGELEHKLGCPTNQPNKVYDLAFSHDGHRILCNCNRTEWTTMGHRLPPRETNSDPDHLEYIRSMAYSPKDNEIVYGKSHGGVLLWKMETNKSHTLGTHTAAVTSISFSPGGSWIASGSSDQTVRIWDARLSGAIDKEMHSEFSKVTLSHDGQWIVTVSLGHIQVWRVTETMTKTNELIIADVWSLALSHDSSRVVIGCLDGSIRVWNHLTNKTEYQIRHHSSLVTCVAFSYDGSHVISGSEDKTVRILDCHMGKEAGFYRHSHQVTCIAFSRDGGRVAFGSYNQPIRIWNPSTGEIHSVPDKWQSTGYSVYSITFSHDGSHVISGWGDKVWIWNVMTNESTKLSERIQLPDGTRVQSLSKGDFYIYDPVDQKTTNGIPPYLLSISPDRDWITNEQGEHICWIPSQYRTFSKAHIAESIVCLQTRHGSMIVLDLKRTMPPVTTYYVAPSLV